MHLLMRTQHEIHCFAYEFQTLNKSSIQTKILKNIVEPLDASYPLCYLQLIRGSFKSNWNYLMMLIFLSSWFRTS